MLVGLVRPGLLCLCSLSLSLSLSPRHVIGSIVSRPLQSQLWTIISIQNTPEPQEEKKNRERTLRPLLGKRRIKGRISLGARTDWVCLLGNQGGGLGLLKTGVSLSQSRRDLRDSSSYSPRVSKSRSLTNSRFHRMLEINRVGLQQSSRKGRKDTKKERFFFNFQIYLRQTPLPLGLNISKEFIFFLLCILH